MRPYYTRPMAAGMPDLVDCRRLAESAARLERVYELAGLPRLQDVLAQPVGRVQAAFAFAQCGSGNPGVQVTVHAQPKLRCRRCLGGFDFELNGDSDLEFAESDEAAARAPDREFHIVEGWLVSLRELAEEEFLLALPTVPVCGNPDGCRAADPGAGETVRPFSVLRDLLKNT